MLKTLIVISVAVVCCRSQLDIPKRATIGRFGSPLIASHVPAVGVAPIGAVAAAPVAVAAPAPLPFHIQKIRTHEVLPIQDLGVVNPGPQVVQVRSEQEPVLVHFQSQSAPVQVETSHIPSPPGETTVTQSQDEPHRVIHEIIRPVIQEVREIIQPYRRVTQEIRPVQEEVQTDVAAGVPRTAAVGPASVAVAAPAPVPVAAPTLFRNTAPANFDLGIRPQTVVTGPIPQRNLFQNIVAAPTPLFTGSYIQQFIDQIGLRKVDTPLVASRPHLRVDAPVVGTAPVVAEAVEPIAAEAAALVPIQAVPKTPKLVGKGGRIGSVSFSRKYAEY